MHPVVHHVPAIDRPARQTLETRPPETAMIGAFQFDATLTPRQVPLVGMALRDVS